MTDNIEVTDADMRRSEMIANVVTGTGWYNVQAFAAAHVARHRIEATRDLSEQIDRLANFIMHEVPSEPSQSQGAVDTAIRIIREKDADIARLREAIVRINNLSKNLCSNAENAVLTVGLELHKATRAALKEQDDGQH